MMHYIIMINSMLTEENNLWPVHANKYSNELAGR